MAKSMLFWSLLCILFLFMISTSAVGTSVQPNIILIVADDLGYNDVSFHGSDQIPTPNLDHLAHTGIILNNYYVSPICTPTRSALLTGRHPIHTGMQHDVISGTETYGLPLSETLLPEYLNKLGYRSHIVGKWHLGMFKWEYTPLHRGFESHLGYYQGREDYFTHVCEARLGHVHQWGVDFRRDKEMMWNYTGKYSTDIFRDEAVRIIRNHNKSEPLFLYLPFQAVHSGNADSISLQAPVELIRKFNYIENIQRRTYAAIVASLDNAVGTIYDTLRDSGMLDNSIIVFTTDNGGPANGYDGNAASNFPLRGIKNTLWEGGVRGVGFIHSPLLRTSGYVSDHLLHVCDWLPTLFRAAGGNPDTLQNLDGFDAWDMLSRNGSAVRGEVLHNIDPISDFAAIRIGDYKLLVGEEHHGRWDKWYPPYQLNGDEVMLNYRNLTDSVLHEVVNDRHRQNLHNTYREYWSEDVYSRLEKLQTKHNLPTFLEFSPERNITLSSPEKRNFISRPVRVKCGDKPANASTNCDLSKSPCLFDISKDPCEFNNIADSHFDVVSLLLHRLKAYSQDMVPPGNKPLDDRGNPKHHGGAWIPWI